MKITNWFSSKFPDYKKLPKSGKFLAWLTLVQGIAWLGLALSAAWNAFKFRAVGFRRMIYVFAPCVFQIAFASSIFSFSFYLDSVLKLQFHFSVNHFALGVNFAAIIFIVLAVRNLRYFKTISQNENVDPSAEPLEQGQDVQP
ncbi:hypothetical protein [Neisseria mucosa]|uniref:hypothetical protein n=1 Tax=Neisseria mucosa TaxID=488 RepID=UPI0009F4285B|nr:hypothetical protein [Neisseria mucosa]